MLRSHRDVARRKSSAEGGRRTMKWQFSLSVNMNGGNRSGRQIKRASAASSPLPRPHSLPSSLRVRVPLRPPVRRVHPLITQRRAPAARARSPEPGRASVPSVGVAAVFVPLQLRSVPVRAHAHCSFLLQGVPPFCVSLVAHSVCCRGRVGSRVLTHGAQRTMVCCDNCAGL